MDQSPSFQGLELADGGEFNSGTQTTSIDLLIGSDHYWYIVTGNIIWGDSDLVAVSSKFRWLVSEIQQLVHLIQIETAPIIDSDITKEWFWELESLDIIEKPNVIDSVAFPQDTKFDWTLGQYILDLPWRSGCWPQSGFYNVWHCLGDYEQDYKKIPEGVWWHAVRGWHHWKGRDHWVWHYLPHHGVIWEDKQMTKLRIVFDGSAKEPNQLSV